MSIVEGLDGIDLLADTWGHGEPHDQFARLRAEAPVFWHPEADGPGFWAVTKHADICAVDKDPETFTSEKYVNLEEVDDDLMDLRRSILETDGLRHRALRKLIQREFTPGPLSRKYGVSTAEAGLIVKSMPAGLVLARLRISG